MADRRTEESPVAPRRSLGGPRDESAASDRVPGERTPSGRSGGPSPQETQERITERVNAAYASSGPVLPDETDGTGSKPTAGDRFAAAMAAARSGDVPAGGLQGGVPKPGKKVRKARLRLTHIDPWSVMKTSFLLSVALGIVTVVSVFVVWSVLGAAGVWDSIDKTVGDIVGDESGAPFRIEDYLGMSRVLGFTMIVAVVDVVLMTVIATLGAFLYNLAAVLLGGLELTLAEDERPSSPRS